MDKILANVQIFFFRIGSKLFTKNLNIFDKLGNKMQDFRSRYTTKR